MKFEIKNWLTGGILFTLEGESWQLAFKAAVKSGQSFRYADLSGKDFSGVKVDGGEFYNSTFYNSTFYNSTFYNSTFDAESFKGIPEQWFINCRDDLWSILLTVPGEVQFLRQALVDGKVDGSTYTATCACLVGTLAHARQCNYTGLGILKPNSSRNAERYFLQIRPGGTPDKNPFAKKAVEWIDQFVELQVAAAKVFAK